MLRLRKALADVDSNNERLYGGVITGVIANVKVDQLEG
jgi:hypothetical protein